MPVKTPYQGGDRSKKKKRGNVGPEQNCGQEMESYKPLHGGVSLALKWLVQQIILWNCSRGGG